MVLAVALFLASAVFVDLVGYWLHRWAHRPRSPLYRAHMTHHIINYPPKRAIGPSYQTSGADSLIVWFAPFGFVYAATIIIAGVPHPEALLLGGALTAVISSVLHDASHLVNSLAWRLMPRRSFSHIIHHHRMSKNFGIVSGLWDLIFGTSSPER